VRIPLRMPGELERYARQVRLDEIGEAGQRRLLDGHATIVGVGSLGCLSSELLVRAGVGRITLIDRDIVERSNLSRQTLFTEGDADAGLPKAEAARRRLASINADIRIEAHTTDLNASNAEAMLDGADVIVDGVDTYDTRYLLNDVAVKRGVAYVHGGVVGSAGSMMVVRPGVTACMRCLEGSPPAPGSTPTCESAGVFGPAAAMVASLQAAMAMRVLLDHAIDPRLWRMAPLEDVSSSVSLEGARDPDCPCCARGVFEFLDADPEDAAHLCSGDSVQITPRSGVRLDLLDLASRLAADAEVSLTPYYVRGRLREYDASLTVFPDARVIVSGVHSVEDARRLHARYIGG
ncbi:MAG: ThiF family adenylyltransferase, partial [Planctomycetota bacterium]